MRKKDDPDDKFDRECVYEYEDVAKEGVKVNYEIPSYEAKAAPMVEEVTAAGDQEAMAWKAMNAAMNATVSEKASAEYVAWTSSCTSFFAKEAPKIKSTSTSGQTTTVIDKLMFPRIIHESCEVNSRDCLQAPTLDICQHDLLRVLQGSGVQTEGEQWIERLKRERLRWHPDMFGRKMGLQLGKRWESEAKEIFQMVQALIEREEK